MKVPPPFNFRSAAYSHGWVVLSPTVLNEENDTVEHTLLLKSGKVVHFQCQGAGTRKNPKIEVEAGHKGRLGSNQKLEITQAVNRMFRIEEDFTEFYDLCRAKGGRWTSLTDGAGRLLRSPTLFEDIVKTICTTNIQWSGTKSMVRNLVDAFGVEYPLNPDLKTFPTPQAIAASSTESLASARLGYRAPYILELSQKVSDGTLDLVEFEDPDLPTDTLRKMLLGIKGVGAYAAATLLMLLGRYEYLGFDTEMRDFVAKHYLDGVNPTAEEAFVIYADWGNWKYLAYWFDNYG